MKATNFLKTKFNLSCCFTSTETIRLLGDGSPGWPPRLSHSSLVLFIYIYNTHILKASTDWLTNKRHPLYSGYSNCRICRWLSEGGRWSPRDSRDAWGFRTSDPSCRRAIAGGTVAPVWQSPPASPARRTDDLGGTGKRSTFNVALRPQRPYGLLGTGSLLGRPPRLSHSSWTLNYSQFTDTLRPQRPYADY